MSQTCWNQATNVLHQCHSPVLSHNSQNVGQRVDWISIEPVKTAGQKYCIIVDETLNDSCLTVFFHLVLIDSRILVIMHNARS